MEILGTSCKECTFGGYDKSCDLHRDEIYAQAGKKKKGEDDGGTFDVIEAICPYYTHIDESICLEEVMERAKIPISFLVIDRGDPFDLGKTLQSILDSDTTDKTCVYVAALDGDIREVAQEKLEGKIPYLVCVKTDPDSLDESTLNALCTKVQNAFICVVEAGQSVYKDGGAQITTMINDQLVQLAIYNFNGYYGCMANIAKAIGWFSVADLREKLEYFQTKAANDFS